MSKNVFVFCLLLSIFFYHLDFFPTFYNMQSVSSSGVYNALNVATRVEPISGLFIYKIGRFCYFEMSKEVSGTSPIVFGIKLPQGYIPQGSSCRFTYINNGTDMPEGQLGFYTDGNIRMYKGGGGTINCTAKCNGMYLSTT